jgi:hypothetical protein
MDEKSQGCWPNNLDAALQNSQQPAKILRLVEVFAFRDAQLGDSR